MNWDQGWSINPSDLHLMSIYLIRIGKPVEQKHIRMYYEHCHTKKGEHELDVIITRARKGRT